MPYIKVNLGKINEYSSIVKSAQNKLNLINTKVNAEVLGLGMEYILFSGDIQKRINTVSKELNAEKNSLRKMSNYLSDARSKYSKLDTTTNKMKTQSDVGAAVGTSKMKVDFDGPLDYISLKSLLKDVTKTGGTIYNAYKAGFFSSGFDIKQVGDYIRIYGKRAPRAAIDAPKGARVKVGSDAYYSKGYALWYKGATIADRFKSAFSGYATDTFGLVNSAGKFNVGAALGYVEIAYDTIKNLVGNVKNGASASKIVADATTDVAKGLGSMAVVSAGAKVGAAIGSFIPIPGVGTLVGAVVGGAVAGFAYKYVVDGGIKIGGKSIAGWVSTGIETACDAVGNAVKSGAQAVAKVATNVAQEAAKVVTNVVQETTKAVTNVAKSVGNAVSSAAKSVKNFLGKLF